MLSAENQAVLAAFVRAEPAAALATLAPADEAQGAACAASAEGLTFFPSPTHQGGFVGLLRKRTG